MWGIVMWTTGRSVDYLDQEACINHIDPGFGMFFEEESEPHCYPIGVFDPGA